MNPQEQIRALAELDGWTTTRPLPTITKEDVLPLVAMLKQFEALAKDNGRITNDSILADGIRTVLLHAKEKGLL